MSISQRGRTTFFLALTEETPSGPLFGPSPWAPFRTLDHTSGDKQGEGRKAKQGKSNEHAEKTWKNKGNAGK